MRCREAFFGVRVLLIKVMFSVFIDSPLAGNRSPERASHRPSIIVTPLPVKGRGGAEANSSCQWVRDRLHAVQADTSPVHQRANAHVPTCRPFPVYINYIQDMV